MAGTGTKLMTVEEFFVWQQGQEDRYELVEGVPVILRDPITMMTGASSLHDRITSNVLLVMWPAT